MTIIIDGWIQKLRFREEGFAAAIASKFDILPEYPYFVRSTQVYMS